jgi:DNA invertase Pin-like site-specific DNA recombinase
VRRFCNGNIQTRRAYIRVSTSDKGQTVEDQLQPLQETAGRLGWTVVAIYRDEGISGTRGRDKRPGLDALLKGVASGQMWIAN